MPRSLLQKNGGEADKEKEFALALIENRFNGTQAAIAIGYSKNGAGARASALLTNSKVQEYLAIELEKIREAQNLTIQSMYEEWRRIAYSNMDDYSYEGDEGETVIKLPHGNRVLMAAVKKIRTIETSKMTDDGETEILTRRVEMELHDKVGAMEKLSRLFNMFDGKEAPVTIVNGNVQFNDNRHVENKTVIVNVNDAAEEYRKLIGR